MPSLKKTVRTGRPRNRGSFPDSGKRFSSSPKHPDRLWDPPGLLFNVYRGTRALSTGVRQSRRGNRRDDVKYKYSSYVTSIYSFMACTGPTLP